MSLFPLTLRRGYPAPFGSLDVDFMGEASDGHEYVIKTVAKTPQVPAAEWICHRLAGICHIATPQYNKIDIGGGVLAFGSQWDAAAVRDMNAIKAVLHGAVAANSLSEGFSTIYTFDLFTHNDDRHLNNFLFVASASAASLRAFDFSRGWSSNGMPAIGGGNSAPRWPLPPPPFDAACNTITCAKVLRKAQPWNWPAAHECLEKLRKVPARAFQVILDEIPDSWLARKAKANMMKWWTNGKDSRVKTIDKALETNDAAYL